ncbi:MAG: hypothetical protein HF967_06715 [Methanosarcinales archaeon]|nr:hypothetical protein [Methanosarcinales archaeon]
MNLKSIYNSIVKDTRAVSPVVASLILVVVAVVGAATIGVMMGVVGEDVGEQADADQVGDASKAMIELGSCDCEWELLRPFSVDFTHANPGVGILRHAICCENNPFAVSEGIADVGVMGTCGRAIGFIVQADPTDSMLNAFIEATNTDGQGLTNLTENVTSFYMNGVKIPEYNITTLKAIFTNDTIIDAEENTADYTNFLSIKTAVVKDAGLKANWANYLVGLNVQEFSTRIEGDEFIYFFTRNDPAPIEAAYIDFLRLQAFV